MGEHFHFDADAILAAQREKRQETFAKLIEAVTDPNRQDFLKAQFAAFEGQDFFMRLLIQMRNEERSPAFIGSVIGAAMGNIMASAMESIQDPRCSQAIIGRINDALAAMDGRPPAGAVDNTSCYHGQRGGRA